MQVWTGAKPQTPNVSGAVVTLGNFDGLHLGHQALLHAAGKLPGPRVVLTFDPHPVQLLYPERGLKRLLPRQDLAEQLPKYAVDVLWIIPFTREFSGLSPDAFLEDFVRRPFAPKHLVIGYDFAFGHGRAGQVDLLRRWSKDNAVGLHAMSEVKVNGEVVSSRRLRELIVAGEVERAAKMLGRPFYLRGTVVPGEGRGSKILVPTLNQRVVNETLPEQGVYISRIRHGQGEWPAVTNVGINRTFHNAGEIKVETHALVSCSLHKGDVIDVDLVQRLRPEKKFDSVEDLKRQIQSDILKAKEFFKLI